MFTDNELDILEFEIFPIVIKFNDIQKVFDNLDETQKELFLKGCEYDNVDTSEIAVGIFWKEEEDGVLYLRGSPKNGYTQFVEKRYATRRLVAYTSRQWSTDIRKIITETKIILPKSCRYLFWRCGDLISIEGTEKGDTSRVEIMTGMFERCKNLKSIDVSTGDVSNVKYMSDMFYGCETLKELDFSKGNTKNLKVSRMMFSLCAALEEVDVSNGNVSNLRDAEEMFYFCESLKEIKGILDGDVNLVILNKKNIFKGINPALKDLRKIRGKFIFRP